MKKFTTLKYFGFIMLTILLTQCEEKYVPDLGDRYSEVLVVDGMITNGPGPYQVRLMLSSPVDHPEMTGLAGCTVTMSDDAGNNETLTSDSAGYYHTAANGLQGVPGRQYQLTIATPAGQRYASQWEILKTPVPFDSLYGEIGYQTVQDYPYQLPGYQFYLDVSASANDSANLLWRLTETWQYQSDFKLYYIYDGVMHPVNFTDSLRDCWSTNKLQDIFLLDMQELTAPQITHFPLHFRGTDTRKLSVRYSLLAQQLNISAAAYGFWKTIRDQNSAGGELYTRQPYQLRGNIYNMDNPDLPVYGFFMAAGVSQHRIFINRPAGIVSFYYSQCELNQADYERYGTLFIGPPPPPDDPAFITQDANGGRALPSPECINCLLKGGTNQKPDYWNYD
ncbi:MAG: DUF4249 domain-containing protein [Clostridia bacterium]|nr:DUF4249 domain-containing protein [Clostridia bacterium]